MKLGVEEQSMNVEEQAIEPSTSKVTEVSHVEPSIRKVIEVDEKCRVTKKKKVATFAEKAYFSHEKGGLTKPLKFNKVDWLNKHWFGKKVVDKKDFPVRVDN